LETNETAKAHAVYSFPMNNRMNLFGQGPKAGRDSGQSYGRGPPVPPPATDYPMAGSYEDPRGSYGSTMPSRTAVGRGQPSPGRGAPSQLSIAKIDFNPTLANQYIFGNL